MMELKLTAAARIDVNDQFEFWENKTTGLGFEFIEQFEFECSRIRDNAEAQIFPKRVVGDIWKQLTGRFSTVIYFEVQGDAVVVTAVFNVREDPDRIIQQLKIR